jgi:hypothetical protein
MRRFTIGAIRFFGTLMVVYYLQSKFDLTHLQYQLSLYLKGWLGNDLSSLILLALYLVILYLFFYLLISGAYYLAAWEYPISFFESNSKGKGITVYGNPTYGNINRIVNYREEKMGMMTNEQKVRFLMETSKLDNLYSSSGANTQRTLNYINARLGMMSNEKGLDFLKNGIK